MGGKYKNSSGLVKKILDYFFNTLFIIQQFTSLSELKVRFAKPPLLDFGSKQSVSARMAV